MDHDYKAAHEFWLSGLYLEKPITNTEKAIDSALEIARKLQEGEYQLFENTIIMRNGLEHDVLVPVDFTAAQETRKG